MILSGLEDVVWETWEISLLSRSNLFQDYSIGAFYCSLSFFSYIQVFSFNGQDSRMRDRKQQEKREEVPSVRLKLLLSEEQLSLDVNT